MHRQHLRTLEALFAHPLEHGVPSSRVEALFRSLGAEVTPIRGGRLRIRMPTGQDTWLHHGCGLRSPNLDGEAVLRLRHLLQTCGITPSHPEATPVSPRGDRSLRLVLHLSHHATEAWRFEQDDVRHERLVPHGLWGSGENLSHRHDRDIAGQRAPLDAAYLADIIAAMANAEAVLLLGHGQGESDMRQLLLHHLQRHRPDLIDRVVGVVRVDSAALSEAQILALARAHFGNLPHRRARLIPGQEPA
ncbi:MAG: hypothetical protein VKN13_04205 [Cyanobacteriota bacterium]|nr:hypothetical protein [Cyanobacteriota bacterium]